MSDKLPSFISVVKDDSGTGNAPKVKDLWEQSKILATNSIDKSIDRWVDLKLGNWAGGEKEFKAPCIISKNVNNKEWRIMLKVSNTKIRFNDFDNTENTMQNTTQIIKEESVETSIEKIGQEELEVNDTILANLIGLRKLVNSLDGPDDGDFAKCLFKTVKDKKRPAGFKEGAIREKNGKPDDKLVWNEAERCWDWVKL
tara:strand:+ start:1115 stop:1711 length:597 start_codon:yes stop_codon:yes gene_type:complete